MNFCNLTRLFRNFIKLNPQASHTVNSLIFNILKANSFASLNKKRKIFIQNVLISFLSIKYRINFLQLERYGDYCEQSYRESFKKDFDFFEFNKTLVLQIRSKVIIGFDPSYLSKSGNKTYGVGYFWSGVAGKAKWGLDMAGFALIDPELNTAFHLNAVQTPPKEELETSNSSLLEYYGSLITQNADKLKAISDYIVADAYFSKLPFLKAVSEAKLFLISRLRDDSNLMYLYNGPLTGTKGAPKKYAGKVNFENIDKKYFLLEFKDDTMEVYGAILHSVAFKRKIKVAFVRYLKNGKVVATKIYCSANTKQDTMEILQYLKSASLKL